MPTCSLLRSYVKVWHKTVECLVNKTLLKQAEKNLLEYSNCDTQASKKKYPIQQPPPMRHEHTGRKHFSTARPRLGKRPSRIRPRNCPLRALMGALRGLDSATSCPQAVCSNPVTALLGRVRRWG